MAKPLRALVLATLLGGCAGVSQRQLELESQLQKEQVAFDNYRNLIFNVDRNLELRKYAMADVVLLAGEKNNKLVHVGMGFLSRTEAGLALLTANHVDGPTDYYVLTTQFDPLQDEYFFDINADKRNLPLIRGEHFTQLEGRDVKFAPAYSINGWGTLPQMQNDPIHKGRPLAKHQPHIRQHLFSISITKTSQYGRMYLRLEDLTVVYVESEKSTAILSGIGDFGESGSIILEAGITGRGMLYADAIGMHTQGLTTLARKQLQPGGAVVHAAGGGNLLGREIEMLTQLDFRSSLQNILQPRYCAPSGTRLQQPAITQKNCQSRQRKK